MEVEVVRRHVGNHADVVVQGADPSQEDAAPGRLQDRQVDARLGQRPGRAAEPRVVPLFHQPVVQVDAVGRRIGHGEPGGPAEVGQGANGRRLPVGPGDRDDRDRGIGHRGRRARFDVLQARGGFGHHPSERAAGAEQFAELDRDLPAQGFGHTPATPRIGHHDLVTFRSQAGPNRQVRSRGIRQRPSHMGGQPSNEPATSLRPRGPRSEPGAGPALGAGESAPGGHGGHPVLGRLHPSPDGQRELHCRPREVDVGAVEHAQLDQKDGLGRDHCEYPSCCSERATGRPSRHPRGGGEG